LNVVNNHLILLAPTTVHADASPNTLIGSTNIDHNTGMRMHNWFFFDFDDLIVNFLGSNDHVTKGNEPNSLVLAPSAGAIERQLHIIGGARGSKEAGTKKKVEGAKSSRNAKQIWHYLCHRTHLLEVAERFARGHASTPVRLLFSTSFVCGPSFR
jgi:hypothetical protein